MPLFGKPSARQKEIRRSKAERRGTWRQRLLEQVRFGPLSFIVLCAVAAAFIVNLGEDKLDLRVGQQIPRALTARFTFRLVDERATDRMRAQAYDNAEDYYELDQSLLQDIRGKLSGALRMAREHAAEPERLREKAAQIKILLDDGGLGELVRLANEPDSEVYQRAVDRALRTLRAAPLVEANELAQRRTGINAVLVDAETETQRPVASNELLFASNPEHVAQVVERAVTAADFPSVLKKSLADSLARMLSVEEGSGFKPLYRYDTGRSARAAQEAEKAVQTQYNVFPAGTRLVDAGPLSEDELELLREEHTRFFSPNQALQDESSQRLIEETQLAGVRARWSRGVLVFLLVLGVGGFIRLGYSNLLGSPRRWYPIAGAMLVILLLARTVYLQTPVTYLAAGVYALSIALLAIASGRGPAYAVGALLALLIASATRQGVPFTFVLLSVALVVYFGLRDLRQRGRIILVGLLAGGVALVVTQFAGLIDGQRIPFVFWSYAVWAGLSTLAAAFLVEGILPGIERIFGVTTSLKLLEWCDPNKPLLRMLAAESPGTYNHSLLVGTLADAAAEAIGANGLLARTGAYYHDIGKINKPEYFVENQAMGVGNRHERLSPAMSHLIIIGHVKDGIEMAKEYGLPRVLHPFIPEHHGTCVVEYFYHAANRARKPGDPAISDEQFRYPGPKPQTPETAIVMMCDAVEGAVRAMSEPTPNRIEDTVDRIIQKRMMDGQFDECDLTFRELETIRNSLVKSLSSIYHGRIVYPSGDKDKEKPPETRTAS